MSEKVVISGGRQPGKTAAALARLERTLRAQERSREAMEMAFLCVEFGMSLFGAELSAFDRAWADPMIGKRSMGEALAAKRWELLRTPGV